MKSLSQYILEKYYDASDEEKETYEKEYKELIKLAKDKSTAKRIIGNFSTALGGCATQWLRFDALEEADVPHHIKDNSVFIDYKIDFKNRTVEVFRTGHIYLSKADLQTDKYKYLAMKGMENVYVQGGNYDPENPKVNKKFRRSKFKSIEDLYNKMEKYFEDVMKVVDEYSGGYPYKGGE